MGVTKTAKQANKSRSPSSNKITYPYLDPNIDPSHLDFTQAASDLSHCQLKKEYTTTIQLGDKQILLYSHPNGILGEGAFGTVSLAQDAKTREWYAIKIPKENKQIQQREKDQLSASGNLILHDDVTGMTVMKLLPGDELFKVMFAGSGQSISTQSFSTLQKLAVAKSILKKIAHLHHDVSHMKGERDYQKKVIHRDIKSENIKLNSATLEVNYCDYGMAVDLQEDKSSPELSAAEKDVKPTKGKFSQQGLSGTQYYLAPELLKSGVITYNEKTEVFAVGMVLAEIFDKAKYADEPFVYKDNDGKTKRIARYQVIPNKHISKELNELIDAMTNVDPAKRPTIVQANIILNRIFANEGKIAKTKVCVISIDDFLKYDGKKKNKIINQIIQQEVNAVTLYGSNTISMEQYLIVKRQLINAGILSIAPFMVKSTDLDVVCRVACDHYNQTLATLNTAVLGYDSAKNKFSERKIPKSDVLPSSSHRVPNTNTSKPLVPPSSTFIINEKIAISNDALKSHQHKNSTEARSGIKKNQQTVAANVSSKSEKKSWEYANLIKQNNNSSVKFSSHRSAQNSKSSLDKQDQKVSPTSPKRR